MLKANGPSLTSDVIARMVSDGASESAARKRVQRSLGDVERLAGVRFEKNARFIYLPDQYGTDAFWRGLEGAFHQAGKTYWATVVNLLARGGRCPKGLFARVTGAPAARTRQLSPDRIFERLSAINLLEEVEVGDGDGTYVQFRPLSYVREAIPTVRARLLAENIALHGVKEWARRIGFGSYGRFAMRLEEPAPVVSGISWDLTAPSYFRPLISVKDGKAKPGFLVCDINLTDTINEAEAEAFVRKCDMASAPSNVGPIMPLLIGHVFSAAAFDLAKRKGILAITLQNLFGDEIAEALKNLVAVLTDAGATASVNPGHLDSILQSLTKVQGAADNLRGTLFELVIGSLVKDVDGGFLTCGERCTDLQTGREAEIDVQLNRDDKSLLVLECKAKLPGSRVSETEVRKWYSDRIPLIQKILTRDGLTEKTIRFEIWSNGEFTDSALKWLKKQQLDFESYSLGWLDGKGLKAYADKAKQASLRKILNEHYFRHPMAEAARKASRELEAVK